MMNKEIVLALVHENESYHMYNEISEICVANQCVILDQLSSKRCPRIAGKECAGKGVGFP